MAHATCMSNVEIKIILLKMNDIICKLDVRGHGMGNHSQDGAHVQQSNTITIVSVGFIN